MRDKLSTKRNLAIAAAAAFFTLGFAGTAQAGSYTLNCVDATSGAPATVTITASSRAAAIDKARNDPAYSGYDKCK